MEPELHPHGHSPEAVARRERRLEEKRRVVVRATLDLIDEGVLDPTIQAIVERSGTPERSIFRWFDKLELALEAYALAAEDLGEKHQLTDIGEGTLDERIDRLASTRSQLLSKLRNPARAARMRIYDAPDLDRAMAENAKRLRDTYAVHFSPELDAMDVGERESVLDAITTLLSFDGFEVLVHRLGFEPARVAATWRASLHRLLAAPSPG